MNIQSLANTILNLLYEYFTEHNASKPMSEADIVSFINKEDSDIKGNYIEAALDYLIESGQIKKEKEEGGLSFYKIRPDGLNSVENKSQQHNLERHPIVNIYGEIHINDNNRGIISTKGRKQAQSYYESSEKIIPKYYDSAYEVIDSTRKMIQMYTENKTITPALIEEADNRVDVMEKLIYSEKEQ